MKKHIAKQFPLIKPGKGRPKQGPKVSYFRKVTLEQKLALDTLLHKMRGPNAA